jgi:AraC-like DNA-binding protein
MRKNKRDNVQFEDLAWLLNVTESRQPLTESSPVWVRSNTVTEGPPTPHPECHPHCEISMVLEGGPGGKTMIERESVHRGVGDLLLLGPGVPHWGAIDSGSYPVTSVAIYFLPWVLIEMGPESDGVRILRRFTARQRGGQRVVHLPPKHRVPFREFFEQISHEFSQVGFGREVRLRTLLMEMLVRLVRWEQSLGRDVGASELDFDWQPILKTLKYLRDNYTEPIYATNLARAIGVSESRLKSMFQRALGISWVKYLQGYRIHRAASLLNNGGHNVTEAAMSVGFDSLSHFNKTFHSFMGTSPKEYGKPKAH